MMTLDSGVVDIMHQRFNDFLRRCLDDSSYEGWGRGGFEKSLLGALEEIPVNDRTKEFAPLTDLQRAQKALSNLKRTYCSGESTVAKAMTPEHGVDWEMFRRLIYMLPPWVLHVSMLRMEHLRDYPVLPERANHVLLCDEMTQTGRISMSSKVGEVRKVLKVSK